MAREMKDSGVKWIGNIPKDWDVAKFKHFVLLYNGNSISDSEKDKYEDSYNAIPYIPTRAIDVVMCLVDYNNGMYVKQNDYSFKRAQQFDILLCIEGGSAGKKKCYLDQEVAFGNKLCCFHSKNNIYGKFLFYTLCSNGFENEFLSQIQGLIGGVSINSLKDFSFCYPSFNVQQAIADFLDTKCSEIDSLLEDLDNEVKTLNEYKKSIIAETVTHGLNPNAKFVETNLGWIDRLPKHWTIARIASVYSVRNEKVSDKDFPPLSVTMKGIVPQLESAAKTKHGDDRKLIRKGDFVINSRSDRRGSCGISDYDGSCSLINTVLSPLEKMNPQYYNWLFHTSLFADEFYKWGYGIVDDLWTTNWGAMRRIQIPMPPLDEQAEIAAYLDEKVPHIEQSIANKLQQIEALKEYKASLIYEYVTGKKQVI